MRSTAHLKSHPIHPMLVSLPIGLWLGAFVFDVLAASGVENQMRSAGFYCSVGGCVGAVLAAVPGVMDLFGTVPPKSSARNRGYIHGMLNTLALILFILVAYHRGNAWEMPDNISLSLSGAGVIAILISGWLGGTLVYRNQIGIERLYANAGKLKERSFSDFTKPVCNQGELSEGQMMLVKIGEERIAVGRCPSGVVAFSDSCSHKGGSLADGALVGCTVQCPWHGSQFDCNSGKVVAGPAEKSIKTYDVDVRNGEVWVRDPRANPDSKKAA